ncbi:hypothetical protein SCA6_008648 [Theobroma cacao]
MENFCVNIDACKDKEKKILSLRDRGIRMTKEDLIKNLGTIAKFGPFAFVEKMQSSGDLNLIGQFGIGFYSVYLVADCVEYARESKADWAFAIYDDTWNEPLRRGIEIRLHLRDEAQEYLEEGKLKELVKKYCEFINFPIYIWASKEVGVEVPINEDEWSDEEETTDSTSEEGEDENAEKSEHEDTEKKPKTKKVKETSYEWELLNDVKAIWLRSPKDVKEEEYTKFYHSLATFGNEKPLAWSHFSAKGDVEFKAVLFVPPKAPHELHEIYYNSNKANLKLYVRRVFISDEFDELLPKYLSFLKGLVDSDTLPLHVSREMLQARSNLKTIKKKLIRKALDMICKIDKEDSDESILTLNIDGDAEVEKSGADDDKKKGQYAKFWNEFGKSIKLGIIEHATNRKRLAKLLRFERHQQGTVGKISTLGVIFFTDPVDEYLMQYLVDYDGKQFQNVSKEGLKIGNVEETETKTETKGAGSPKGEAEPTSNDVDTKPSDIKNEL